MKLALVVACFLVLVQVAFAGAQLFDPDQYALKCRQCDGHPVVQEPPVPVIVKVPSSDGWLKTLGVLLLGSTLTLLIQRQLKVLEQRFAFLREAMALGMRCDKAALRYLTAAIHHAHWEHQVARAVTALGPGATEDTLATVVAEAAKPDAAKVGAYQVMMREAREELGATFFEAVNLLVPMPVLFSKKVQEQYMKAVNCYATERHRFAPTQLRDSVREFHKEWQRFNALGSRACWTRYRRTESGALVLSKEDRETLEQVLHGADEASAKLALR